MGVFPTMGTERSNIFGCVTVRDKLRAKMGAINRRILSGSKSTS